MKRLIVTAMLLVSSSAFAQERSWTSYALPGMTCGNGDPYKFFVSKGTAGKVAFAFEGGGACWSYDSCFGFIKTTDLKAPATVKETGGYYSLNSLKSPVYDHTIFYFPYCTGDVYAGSHTANYKGKTVHHTGYDIVIEGLKYLEKNMWSYFKNATELNLYGASAGAMGALVHIRNFDTLFGHIPHKSMILDSPGLHFGPTFWHKFSNELVQDYSVAITSAGFPFDYDNGLIAPVIPKICNDLPDWRVGVMQGTRDRVMSLIFGEISSAEHEALVLGSKGIFELTKSPTDNCSAWVPTSGQHTFYDNGKGGPVAGGLAAADFAFEVAGMGVQKNYR